MNKVPRIILQTPFLAIARRMFDDGVYAGRALERSTRLFANRDAEHGSVCAAHGDFRTHFDDLMARIREEVDSVTFVEEVPATRKKVRKPR